MNQDFYPTPKALIKKMLTGIELNEIKNVLEPSAGKGDICDYIASQYSRREINMDVIEIDEELQFTLKGKGYNLIYNDFLSFDTNKIYDLIIANFPFSEGDKHLQRAMDILEKGGGNLVCLVNAETIKNPYTNLRKTIVSKLSKHGANIEYLNGEFENAERKTSVEVALIRLSITKEEGNSVILDALKKIKEVDVKETLENKIIEKDFLKALVSRFNLECELGIRLIEEYFRLKPYMTDRINKTGEKDYSSDLIELEVEGGYDSESSYVNGYLSGVRHKYWELLINDSRFNSAYTSNILEDLRHKLEELRACDFNLFNIQELEKEMGKKIVSGIESSILKLFDEFSHKFAYGEDFNEDNIHYYNGWKTNKAHKINNKVIVPINGFSSYSWAGKDKLEYRIHEKLTDMVKIFNYLSGEVDNVPALVGNTIRQAEEAQKFSSMDLRYFEATFYKKGTCHIKFKDERLLEKFNIYGSQRKGWLPPSYGKKTYKDMNEEEKEIVEDFQGEANYEKVMKEKSYYIVETKTLLLQ